MFQIEHKGGYFRQNVVIFIGAFLIFLFVPMWFNIDYIAAVDSHKIMWLKFIGYDYTFSIFEGPKPLLSFLAGILPVSIFPLLIPCFCAIWLLCLCIMSRRLTGSIQEGFFAFLLFIFSTPIILSEVIFSSVAMNLYITLLILAVVFLVNEQYVYSSLFLFLGGLIRPEVWLNSFLFIAWVLFLKRNKFKLIYCLALIAPFLWIVYDFIISGDMFYSSHAAQDYCRIAQFIPIGFKDFWPMFLFFVRNFFGGWLMVLGIISAVLALALPMRRKGKKIIIILLIIGFVPVFFYFLESFKCNLFIYPRFFLFFILSSCFCAALLPFLFFSNKRIRLVFLMLIFLCSFKTKSVTNLIESNKREKIRTEAAREVFVFLDGYFKSPALFKKIVLGNNADSFSLRYGQDFSHKVVDFREIGSNPEMVKLIVPALAVWLPFNTNGSGSRFDFLSVPKRVTGGYIFSPLFVSHDKLGIVYLIEKMTSVPFTG